MKNKFANLYEYAEFLNSLDSENLVNIDIDTINEDNGFLSPVSASGLGESIFAIDLDRWEFLEEQEGSLTVRDIEDIHFNWIFDKSFLDTIKFEDCSFATNAEQHLSEIKVSYNGNILLKDVQPKLSQSLLFSAIVNFVLAADLDADWVTLGDVFTLRNILEVDDRYHTMGKLRNDLYFSKDNPFTKDVLQELVKISQQAEPDFNTPNQ